MAVGVNGFVLCGSGSGHRIHDALGHEGLPPASLDTDGHSAAGSDLLECQWRQSAWWPVGEVLDDAAFDGLSIGSIPVPRDDGQQSFESFEQFPSGCGFIIGVDDEVLGPKRRDFGCCDVSAVPETDGQADDETDDETAVESESGDECGVGQRSVAVCYQSPLILRLMSAAVTSAEASSASIS